MTGLGKPRWVYLLFVIGAAAIAIRLVLDSDFSQSTLLYIVVPFLVSVALIQLVPRPESERILVRYFVHIRDATIVMLATSAILFEGFICVVMFMPIYYFFASIYFLSEALRERAENRTRMYGFVVPALVAVAALEGLIPATTFERDNAVTRSFVTEKSISQLKANMAAPIHLPQDRHWFLSVFPLPVSVEAGSLAAGDVHKLRFVYKRWFVTNTHEGDFHLRIDEVAADGVRTSVVHNSSYLSKYLKIEGTRVHFDELEDGTTKVDLTVLYERTLDPVWYFGPLQKFAVGQSADYLIQSVIVRDHADG